MVPGPGARGDRAALPRSTVLHHLGGPRDGRVRSAPPGTRRMAAGPGGPRHARLPREGRNVHHATPPTAPGRHPRVPLRSRDPGPTRVDGGMRVPRERRAGPRGPHRGGGAASRSDLGHGTRRVLVHPRQGARGRAPTSRRGATTVAAPPCGGDDRAYASGRRLRPRVPLRRSRGFRAGATGRSRGCLTRPHAPGVRQRRDDAPDRRPRNADGRRLQPGCVSPRISARS